MVGRARSHLDVGHIAAYSPQARGRSERLFRTLQDRLPKELALAGIGTMEAAKIRVERWRVEEQHGRVAALNMLGRSIIYDAVPVFWTIQYLKRLDYVGHASEWGKIVLHGDPGKPQFIAYYIKDRHIAAAAGLDRDRDMAAVIELFTLRRLRRAAEFGASGRRCWRHCRLLDRVESNSGQRRALARRSTRVVTPDAETKTARADCRPASTGRDPRARRSGANRVCSRWRRSARRASMLPCSA